MELLERKIGEKKQNRLSPSKDMVIICFTRACVHVPF